MDQSLKTTRLSNQNIRKTTQRSKGHVTKGLFTQQNDGKQQQQPKETAHLGIQWQSNQMTKAENKKLEENTKEQLFKVSKCLNFLEKC